MDYEDFIVLVAAGRDGPEVRVLRSPAGEGARAPFECALSLQDLLRLTRIFSRAATQPAVPGLRHLRPGAPRDDRFLAEAGERLFRSIFSGKVRDRLLQSLERAPDGLRIRLQLDLDSDPESDGSRPEGVPALHRLPWEILRWPDSGKGPVALSRRTPVVRYLEVEGRVELPKPPDPLGVLVVAPRPSDVPPLALDREVEELRRALTGRRNITLRSLESPTLEGLTEALRGGGVHVLHFMGHGELDPEAGAGVLVLEDASGRSRRLSAPRLVEHLGDFLPPVRLVFLNACRTAEAAAGAPWAGVATALVRAGVPAVLAMQFPVTDRAALTLAAAVYERLAAGAPVDEAVTEGRLAIRGTQAGSPEWATPALFLRVPDGRVFAAPKADRGRRARLVAGLAGGLSLLALAGAWVLRDGAGGPAGRAGEEERGRPVSAPVEAVGEPVPAEAALLAGGSGGLDRADEGDEGPVPASEPAVRDLALGETVHLPEIRADVTAELATILGKEMVKVTVSPGGHDPRVLSGFPGSTLGFRFGDETLSVHLVALDRVGATVRLRVRRSPG